MEGTEYLSVRATTAAVVALTLKYSVPMPSLTENEKTMQSRSVVLQQRPVGMPKQSDFAIIETDVAEPGAGEIQVQNLCMSVDPYMRGRMVDRKSYVYLSKLARF